MIYESKVTDNGGLRYKVQVRQRIDGVIQQRHIWYKTQLGECCPPSVEPWICVQARSLEVWARGMMPNPDYRDEVAEAIAALEDIAQGHNDARQRAAEALQHIREQAA